MPESRNRACRLLVISCGDPGGIGTEILCAALTELQGKSLPSVLWTIPQSLAELLLDALPPSITRPELNIWDGKADVCTQPGLFCLPNEGDWPECTVKPRAKVQKLNGEIAFASLQRATDLVLQSPESRALVTIPFHKSAMARAGFGWPGHTEYLQERASRDESLMLMHSPELSVGLVTNHVPVSRLGEVINAERIRSRALLMLKFMKKQRMEEPLQVLGLDPHCGDAGAIGDFDSRVTSSIVRELGQQGHPVIGPLPADATLAKGKGRFLVMYHDQGLPVFKLLSAGKGMNITLGIPFVRTSPDHGTAFDIAGKGKADPASMCTALSMAAKLLSRR